MQYEQKLARFPRTAGRPEHYAQLLLHPINDDPYADATFQENWEVEHTQRKRFVLGGSRWFINNTGLNANRVAEYRERAITRFQQLADADKINWHAVPGMLSDPHRYWRDMARQQFNYAFGGQPAYLSKLMYVLIACELAVEDLLRHRTRLPNVFPPRITAPEDIYAAMSVIPVCWNVDHFNVNAVEEEKQRDPQFLFKVARHCGQPDDEGFLLALAGGGTVQFETARDIKNYCVDNKVNLMGNVPRVRATHGQFLGRRQAAPGEDIDRG